MLLEILANFSNLAMNTDLFIGNHDPCVRFCEKSAFQMKQKDIGLTADLKKNGLPQKTR